MFVSFTNWELDGNAENAVENIKGFWPQMQAQGATNLRATVTGPNTMRTMTTQSSQKQVEDNIDKVRAAVGTAVGITVTGGIMDTIPVELN